MNPRIVLLAVATLLVQSPAIADRSFSNYPHEAYPDSLPVMTSPGPYTDFIKQVQEKLHARGFDAGPLNGDFGPKTQTALGQFQISLALPASGALDKETLAALDVERPAAE